MEKAGLVESLDVRNQQIAQLEQNYGEISKQLTASQTEIRELRAKLDTERRLTTEILHLVVVLQVSVYYWVSSFRTLFHDVSATPAGWA